jgi:hypothetical protein
VQQLKAWAAEHGVSWDVQLGRTRGRVDAKGPDDDAKKVLAELSRRAGGATPEAAEAERPQLDAKYRDRR